MARCGCTSECNCVLLAGDCITVGGNGTPAAPFIVDVEVDPAVNNQLVCGEDGLLVEPPAAGDCIVVDDSVVPAIISVEVDGDLTNQLVCNADGLFVPPSSVLVADTDCIDLEGTGFPGDPITATPILDPVVENLLECGPNGLSALLYTQDTDCMDLEGDGTAVSPLTADPIISPDVGNVLTCTPNGLYVPTVAPAPVDYRATLRNFGTIPTVMPPSPAGFTAGSVFINFDVAQDVVGLATYIVSDPNFGLSAIEITPGGAGVYQIEVNHPAWDSAPFTPGDLDLWLSITRFDGNLSAIATSGATRFTTVAGGQHTTPWLHVSRTIVLNVGEFIFAQMLLVNYAAVFPGAVLATTPSIGPGLPYVNQPSLSVARIGTI